MHKISYILLFLSVNSLLWSQANYKPMKDTSLFKQKVDKMSKETKSIESDFVQVKSLTVLSEKITSKGSFCFQKQTNLRWEYNSPYKYVIVITKDKILIKDEDRKVKKYDMNSNKVFKEINDIMISCVNGDVLKSGKFNISYFENNKFFKLELIPLSKNMKESLKKINMYFDKNVSLVTKIEMIENGEDMTSIDFTNKQLNAIIPADKFILK